MVEQQCCQPSGLEYIICQMKCCILLTNYLTTSWQSLFIVTEMREKEMTERGRGEDDMEVKQILRKEGWDESS